MKNRLIEIYRNNLTKEFWAHDNFKESRYLKYLFTLLNINLIDIINYWSRPESALSMKYKAMLAIAYKLNSSIHAKLGTFKELHLISEFSDRVDKFVKVLNIENSAKKREDCSSEYSKITRSFVINNEIIRVVVEALCREFSEALMYEGLIEKFKLIYKNITAYFSMFEKEILVLEEIK